MKSYRIIKSTVLLLCVLAAGILSSCSSDDEETTLGASSEELVKFMKNNLYDEQGKVAANILDTYQEGEYNLVADEGSEVCEFFSAMTGVETQPLETYEYAYKSEDGKYQVSIKGTQVANNAIYATLYFSVPECPEIKIIHVGTLAIMNGTNGGNDSDIDTSVDRPHQIKGFK